MGVYEEESRCVVLLYDYRRNGIVFYFGTGERGMDG